VDHHTVVEEWRRSAQEHEEENYQFLRSLKWRDYGYDPDELAAELHEQAFQIVDCNQCANCCKTMDIIIAPEDVERIAKHLDMATDDFVEGYLVAEELDQYSIKKKPCPFLGEDDRCTIYEACPKDCREYPHTDKEGFSFRTMQHADNSVTCPAVFWIVENMKKRSGRRWR
jgi:Fe-S-cluster containining protein